MQVNKSWIVLSVALIVGAAAAFGINRYIKKQVDDIEAKEKGKATVEVVVAKTDLPKGSPLNPETVSIRKVPREWAHSNAITPELFGRAENSKLATPAGRGEPILWAQLEGQKAPSFSARIAPGRRAITVPVDEISSISGMVIPGDMIDLMVNVRKDRTSVMFALMQSVQVLATGTQSTQTTNAEGGKENRTYTTITLDASPEEAKRILAARDVGKVTALLRAPGDKGVISTAQSDPYTLLGIRDQTPVAQSSVPVIYGGGPIANVASFKGGVPAGTTNTAAGSISAAAQASVKTGAEQESELAARNVKP
jgi:pilus assembly protein CpaB